MSDISFFKKIKLYNQYRKILNDNREKLTDLNINLRIDRVNRLYTVINMPDEVKTYGTSLVEKYIKEYISKADNLFNSIGLSELIGIVKINKIDELNYLIVFGFSLFDTARLWNRIIMLSIIGIIMLFILKILI